MKKRICFEANRLNELLPNYIFRKFKVTMCDEYGEYGKDQYYFCLPNVESIEIHDSLFCEEMHITLDNGDIITAMAENVNIHCLDIIRINNNDIVMMIIMVGIFVV